METSICFRVDIDTWEGLQKGVPRCIKLSEENSFPFTYYLSLGKYATGRNLFRIIKNKEKIQRKIPVWRRNHWLDLFRGVLLPSKKINTPLIETLREYEASELIEFHPHGYNHVRWSGDFQHFSKEETSDYLDLIRSEYVKIFDKEPIANAAPNFRVNPFYFLLLSTKHFKFASDFIYHTPFILEANNEKSVCQLPVTEETIECLIMKGMNRKEIIEFYKERFQTLIDNGISYICLYIHAIFEPLKLYPIIEDIIELTEKFDMKALTHSEYFNQSKKFPIIKLEEILTEVGK